MQQADTFLNKQKNHANDRRLISKIYKELLQVNIETANNLIKKMGRGLVFKGLFPKSM